MRPKMPLATTGGPAALYTITQIMPRPQGGGSPRVRRTALRVRRPGRQLFRRTTNGRIEPEKTGPAQARPPGRPDPPPARGPYRRNRNQNRQTAPQAARQGGRAQGPARAQNGRGARRQPPRRPPGPAAAAAGAASAAPAAPPPERAGLHRPGRAHAHLPAGRPGRSGQKHHAVRMPGRHDPCRLRPRLPGRRDVRRRPRHPRLHLCARKQGPHQGPVHHPRARGPHRRAALPAQKVQCADLYGPPDHRPDQEQARGARPCFQRRLPRDPPAPESQARLLHGRTDPRQPQHPGRARLRDRMPGRHCAAHRRLQDRLHTAFGRRRHRPFHHCRVRPPRRAGAAGRFHQRRAPRLHRHRADGGRRRAQPVCPRQKPAHHCGDLRLQYLPRSADHRAGYGERAQGGRQRPQHGLQHRDGPRARLHPRAGQRPHRRRGGQQIPAPKRSC